MGVRNHLLIVSTAGLTGQTARRVASALPGSIVVVLPHSSGLVGRDLRLQRRAIAALATHRTWGPACWSATTPW